MKGEGVWFKIEGSKGDIYCVRLAFDIDKTFMTEESSCDCRFGVFRWSDKNKGKPCIHIKKAHELYKNGKAYKKQPIIKNN